MLSTSKLVPIYRSFHAPQAEQELKKLATAIPFLPNAVVGRGRANFKMAVRLVPSIGLWYLTVENPTHSHQLSLAFIRTMASSAGPGTELTDTVYYVWAKTR